MPYALTDRQKEYLEFIRNYIRENESSPRLEEIADHFGVKPPTAHKVLRTLETKGYLYFRRDSLTGFFIRLIERAGSPESVVEVPVVGKLDRYGEVLDFPEMVGHFASVLVGSQLDEIFALYCTVDIPEASLLENDIIIFDRGKKPQPGDICIGPIGNRLFLLRVHSKTFDRDTPNPLLAQDYPIPDDLSHPELDQDLNWYPLAHTDESHEYYLQVAEEERWPIKPLSPDLVLATALRLTRVLAF